MAQSSIPVGAPKGARGGLWDRRPLRLNAAALRRPAGPQRAGPSADGCASRVPPDLCTPPFSHTLRHAPPIGLGVQGGFFHWWGPGLPMSSSDAVGNEVKESLRCRSYNQAVGGFATQSGVSSSLAQKPWGLLCASCGAGSEIHLKRCLHRPGFLLEFGQLPRSQGKTAKDIAREHQRDDLVQILEGPANCHHTETFARVPQEWAQREPTLP